MIHLLLIFLVAVGAQAQTSAGNLANINVAGALDGLHPLSMDSRDDNRFFVRSAELLFYGAVDTVFDGNLTMAAHEEDGEIAFELEEGFLSTSKLIPRSRLKVGKFLLGVGRLNTFHAHDWPFITAPKVNREFFSPGSDAIEAEGALDTGIEYSYLMPGDQFFEITVGVTNGYCYGHCHTGGSRPKHPNVYLHPSTFIELGSGRGLLMGLSYLGRQDSTGTKTTLAGFDVTYKQRQGKRLLLMMQSEFFYENQEVILTNERTNKAGAYAFFQHGLDERLLIGLRVDAFSHLNRKFETTGKSQKDFDYALVPQVTYKHSEFSQFRLAYSHEIDTTEGLADVRDRQLQLQYVYYMGAHPSHDF